ncbi:hypothetical protein L3X37_11430 [Sabulilitoribacter arenilitoris]|uniref:Uncharacterized protein n=1 Tax=Wocania arenilitoris TaxID=2044858 RepID=A0AAE3ERB7_9FLAO|nr:hypothetical protein [Wocania arenilitoris]MCF7568969.1 hypothetical protein [Wocania arenilitoris]
MNERYANSMFIVFIVSWVVRLIYSNKNFNPNAVGDPDRYFRSFKFYLEHDFYTVVSQGSSLLYNVVISFFYSITHNVSLSFFCTNFISVLLVVGLGVAILFKINKKIQSKYIYVIVAIYAFNVLELNAYQKASNDMFQAVFLLAIFYVFFIFKEKTIPYKYFIIGVFAALCTLIRPTSLILIVLIFVSIFVKGLISNNNYKYIARCYLLFLAPLIFLMLIFHYPAIKENNKLGFYSKNFNKNLNWTQRNYLGIKRMQSGEIPIHKNSIFRKTTFAYVRNYLNENGSESLPKNQIEFLKKDPLLYFQMVVYNVTYASAKYFRYYAFLLVIPILCLFKQPILIKSKLPIYMFFVVILIISLVCFTLIEYRWFTGYGILLSLGLLYGLHFFKTSNLEKIFRSVVYSSLLIISVFNFLLTFFIKSSY